MKILHIIPSFVKGGAERITLDICEELMTYPENEVKLVYFREINEYEYLTEKLNVEKLNISFQLSLRSSSKGNVKELEDLIHDFQPDIIHSHLFESEIMLSQINYNKAKYIDNDHYLLTLNFRMIAFLLLSHIFHDLMKLLIQRLNY